MSRPDGGMFAVCVCGDPAVRHAGRTEWCGMGECQCVEFRPAASPTTPQQPPVDEIVRLSAEAGLYGDVAATAEAEAYAQAAALARVEALRVKWETSDVRLSRRLAANELRRAMEGSDG